MDEVKSKLAGGLLFVSPSASDAVLFPALKQDGVPSVVLNARMPDVDCFVCENRWGARASGASSDCPGGQSNRFPSRTGRVV